MIIDAPLANDVPVQFHLNGTYILSLAANAIFNSNKKNFSTNLPSKTTKLIHAITANRCTEPDIICPSHFTYKKVPLARSS